MARIEAARKTLRRVGEEARSRSSSADQCPDEGVQYYPRRLANPRLLDPVESAFFDILASNSIASWAWKQISLEPRFSLLQLLHLRLRQAITGVNVVADARPEHGPGLGTFAFDEEGVPAQCTPIITNDLFTGYLSSRETAHNIGMNRSGGTLRAESWNRLPIIRMTNISILPGDQPLTREQLIADTDDGIYMETNKSWSIDDKRYNFQFSCEMGWEIKNGKRVRMLKNPSYSGITTEFWNAMDALCSKEEWILWGTPHCGKGQPQQVMGTGHGAAPARFRNIKVGSAYKRT